MSEQNEQAQAQVVATPPTESPSASLPPAAKAFDHTKPLWLPEGSIRALITIGTMTLIGIVTLKGSAAPDWLVLWGGLILKDYFETRKG